MGEEGKLGSPGTEERAPRCLGKDAEGSGRGPPVVFSELTR